ncbi:hypothetical protein Tco_1393926 [Tanacetum coccineum]
MVSPLPSIPSSPLPPIPSPSLPVSLPLPVSSPVPVLSLSPPASPIRSLGYQAAMIRMRAEAASTSHLLPLPPPFILSHTRPAAPSLGTPPLHLLSTNRREDRPEVTLPPRKRAGTLVSLATMDMGDQGDSGERSRGHDVSKRLCQRTVGDNGDFQSYWLADYRRQSQLTECTKASGRTFRLSDVELRDSSDMLRVLHNRATIGCFG